MKIAVFSDSHDHVTNMEQAVSIVKERGIRKVFHLGDYVAPFTIPTMEGLEVVGVLGNNDGEVMGLEYAFDEINGTLAGEFYECTLDGLKMAFYHGTVHRIRDSLVKSGEYDVVFCGHSHQRVNEKTEKTLFVNPGTVNGIRGDGASFAIFDTENVDVEFVMISN